jgi:hypothetical protein
LSIMQGSRLRFEQIAPGVTGLALTSAPAPAAAAGELPVAIAFLFGLCLGLPALIAGLAVGRYAGLKRDIIVLLALVPFGWVATTLLAGRSRALDLALGLATLLLITSPFAVFGWWLGRRARDPGGEDRHVA